MREEANHIPLADALTRLRRAYWGGPTPDELLPIPKLETLWANPERHSLYQRFENSICLEERKLLIALQNSELVSWTSAGQTPRDFWQSRTVGDEGAAAINWARDDSIREESLEANKFDRWLTGLADDPFARVSIFAKRLVLDVLKDLLQHDLVTSHQSRELCTRWDIKVDPEMEHRLLKADRGVAGEFWTVDQALSYILWRDFGRLDLDPLDIFVHLLSDDEEGKLPPRYSLRDANAVLISLLQRGVVRGYAGAVDSNTEIREVEFADAIIVHTNTGHVVAIPTFPSDSMGPGDHFDRLRIVGRDLTREMPPINLGVAEFMSRQEGPIEHPSPNDAGSRFDPHANSMLIGEAALWVGAQGQAFSNSVARADRFEQIGAPRLFAALARGEVGATGLNVATRRIEPIPADVWTECDYGDGQDGKHHFSFIDEEKRNESGGSIRLWPYSSKERPDWCNIRMPNSALLEVFGTIEPTSTTPIAVIKRGSQKGTSTPGLTPTEALFKSAIDREWPEGVPPFANKQKRNNALWDVVVRVHGAGCMDYPNPVTFRRFFKKLEATKSDK